jgi:hypothetical protein
VVIIYLVYLTAIVIHVLSLSMPFPIGSLLDWVVAAMISYSNIILTTYPTYISTLNRNIKRRRPSDMGWLLNVMSILGFYDLVIAFWGLDLMLSRNSLHTPRGVN